METLLKHVRAAQQHYHQALALCPASAITDLGPINHQLGLLYAGLGRTELARDHYEKRLQICEQTGDRYPAGLTRHNMAAMYLRASAQEKTTSRRRDLLDRAQAYAQAALRDFQTYQGHATDQEAAAKELLHRIAEALTALPQ